MSARRPTPRAGWSQSTQFRTMAREAIRAYNATRHSRPKCEAVRRTDGGICQHIAMANGRYYVHGGRTPKGKDWHRRQPGADAVKTQRKLKDIERAAKKRAKRLAAMTPEERKRHEEWQKAHRPGPAGPRAAERARRARSKAAREQFARMVEPSAPSAEAQALAEAIEGLRHQAQRLRADQDISTTNLDRRNFWIMAKSERQIREELIRELQTTGGLKAYQTAMKICDDPEATSAAKASAVNSLLRAGGFFEKQETADEKELHELSGHELAAKVAKLLRRSQENDRQTDSMGGVFD